MSLETPVLTLPADSVATDSVAVDTLPPKWGVVIDVPRPVPKVKEPDTSVSWLTGGLLLCFVVVAIRFKNNGKYLVSLWRDITQVRERRNIFDETVRETSFMVLLNIMWVAVAAVLLGALLLLPDAPGAERFAFLSQLPHPLPRTLTAITLKGALPAVALYTLVMYAGYWTVGNVFSDSIHTRMWIRGYSATNGLESMFLFIIALLTICYPACVTELLLAAGILFVTGKILFFYKGFRIFFSQGSSWVLFLYYLCSLEIVPLVILYVSAQVFGRVL